MAAYWLLAQRYETLQLYASLRLGRNKNLEVPAAEVHEVREEQVRQAQHLGGVLRGRVGAQVQPRHLRIAILSVVSIHIARTKSKKSLEPRPFSDQGERNAYTLFGFRLAPAGFSRSRI